MASKGQLKDMRRDDLIVPYAEPEKDKESNDMQSTMASTLPMAAMFTRNKLIGWTAVMFSIQGWLAETPDQKANASTPGYFSVGMALLSLGVAYMPLFLPPQSAKAGASTGTQAPPPKVRAGVAGHSAVKAGATFVRIAQPSRPHHLTDYSKTLNSPPSRLLERLPRKQAKAPPHYPFRTRPRVTKAVVPCPLRISRLSVHPFAEAEDNQPDTKKGAQDYIHIRIQQRNGRKTLTTVQGLPKKFDQKKILKVIKKKFACNGTIVNDTEMGEVIQLQGDQRKDVQEFLVDKKEGLELDAKTIKVHGF
ncbi:hypothetical protein KC315_g719 [Hortaea werneckii]|nr:hypothetical protein KC315_g719 [Hortaea werneckii]